MRASLPPPPPLIIDKTNTSKPWMYYKNWIPDHPSGGTPIFPSGHSWYCNEKSPLGPKSIFPIGGNSKRDGCKTADRTSPGINTVNYWSLYFIFLSLGPLIGQKVFKRSEKPEESRYLCGDVTALHIMDYIHGSFPSTWSILGDDAKDHGRWLYCACSMGPTNGK